MRLGWCLLLAFALLALAERAAADVPVSERARAHFTAGVNLLRDPDGARYEEAYREFKAAYAASPSWKILGNLGLCAMKIERDSEAVEAFRKYLSEGGAQIEDEEREQFQRDLSTLEAGMVTLELRSTPPGARIVDERTPHSGAAIQNAYGPLEAPIRIGVRPGRHRFTARLPGHQDVIWEVELSPKDAREHVFELPAKSEARGASAANPRGEGAAAVGSSGAGLRTLGYVSLGVGVAGLGVGTYFALAANDKYEQANELCSGNVTLCRLTTLENERREELGREGDQRRTVSIVGFVVGGVGLAAGAALLIWGDGSSQTDEATSFEPFVTVGGAGVRGVF